MRTRTSVLPAFVFLAVGFMLTSTTGLAATVPSRAAAVEALARRYYTFTWNANPVSTTDNGLHTADDKLADFSAAADRAYGAQLRAFRNELAALAPGGTTVHDQVNYLLVRANLEGDYWQRAYLRPLQRNPTVYEEECTNGIFALLKKQFASNAVRARDATSRMRQCPRVLSQGEANLTEPVREFGQVASEEIAGADPLFTQSLEDLTPGISDAQKAQLHAARDQALAALHNYKHWVDAHLSSWHSGGFAVGKQEYDWMLRRVLLLPWDSDHLAQMAQFELARDRALAIWERDHQTYSSAPVHHQPPFTTKAAFLQFYESQTAKVVAFIKSHHLLTIPSYVGRFRIVELPKALTPVNPGGFMNPPGTFDRDPTGFISCRITIQATRASLQRRRAKASSPCWRTKVFRGIFCSSQSRSKIPITFARCRATAFLQKGGHSMVKRCSCGLVFTTMTQRRGLQSFISCGIARHACSLTLA